jgi:dTDP-4-dehydrorhamnose reductase
MKILITGSSGMLGTELCEVLGKENEIVAVDVTGPQTSAAGPRAFYEASVTDAEKMKEIFDKEKPDMVIHAAAFTDVDGCEKDPDRAYEVNVKGTRNIVEAAAKNDVPTVYISTDFVFDGEDRNIPYREDDKCGPLSVYGKTKYEAEKALGNDLSRYAIVRTSWLFGKNGKNFVNTIIAKSKKEKRLSVVDDQVGSPTYATDLAGALARLVDTGIEAKEIFHVSNSGSCSWFEFARQVLSDIRADEDISVEPITAARLGRPAKRPRFSVLDNGKFEKKTGHKMRPWQDALKDYIDNECL